MRTIVEIIYIEERETKNGQAYQRTCALLDNQEEALGFGVDFKPGDQVEAFFEDKWDMYKMQKPSSERGPQSPPRTQ